MSSRSRSRSRSGSRKPLKSLKLNKIFPEGTVWANVVEANSAERLPNASAKAAYVPPHKRNQQEPEEGETRGEGNAMMIYTRGKVIQANGKVVYGKWVRAVDPYGDYGGPYHDLQQLLDNPLYRSNAANILRNMQGSRDYRKNSRNRGRSRRSSSRSSRGRSRSRRHRSSNHNNHSRRRHRSRSRSRSSRNSRNRRHR
jgi:hypothetical protein